MRLKPEGTLDANSMCVYQGHNHSVVFFLSTESDKHLDASENTTENNPQVPNNQDFFIEDGVLA